MHAELTRVLNEYLRAKSEPLKGHPLASWFQDLRHVLQQQVPQVDGLNVVASTGVGNWASVPWIAVCRSDIAPSPQQGLYLVYLFRGDMSGVVLSLNQGVTNVAAATSALRRSTLQERSRALRNVVTVPERFREETITLAPHTPLGRNYEQGHVWGRSYETGSLPDDELLRRDLAELTEIYKGIDANVVAPIIGNSGIAPNHDQPSNSSTTVLILDDPLFRDMDAALRYKRQLVLFGPPGTGKTYIARRFAVSWLSHDGRFPAAPAPLATTDLFRKAEENLRRTEQGARAWWVVANPADWRWETLFGKSTEDFPLGRLQRNYADVRVGDLIFGYEATPTKRIVALARVITPSDDVIRGAAGFSVEALARVQNGPSYEVMKGDATLSQSEPIRFRSQGTLFALTASEQDALATLVLDSNPDLEKFLNVPYAHDSAQLTLCTFHASYSYEDFVEGYRPIASSGSHFQLQLEDGLFKRVCDTARANPDKRYLIIIDELNRANVSKVFGELMTILEFDKRGLPVTLPQSRRQFAIPQNVYIIATMNTADRSIALLDIALRRRFAFLELMPSYDLLDGIVIEQLSLAAFLNELNQRISDEFGRDKQIGHAFLLSDGAAVSTAAAFRDRFRFEVLPLIQELAYADHAAVGRLLGPAFMVSNEEFNQTVAEDVSLLFQALRDGFPDAVRN